VAEKLCSLKMSGEGGSSEDLVVDGAPIKTGTITINGTTYDKYKAVINCGGCTHKSVNLPTSITSIMHEMISLSGMVSNGSSDFRPIPYLNANSSYNIGFYGGSTNISIETGTNYFASYTVYAIIEFY